MTTNHPLTLTVEQAAEVLGIGRSTAYELVRSGDLKHIRLRRRIVVPLAHLAQRLDVDSDAVWAVLDQCAPQAPASPPHVPAPRTPTSSRTARPAAESPTLF